MAQHPLQDFGARPVALRAQGGDQGLPGFAARRRVGGALGDDAGEDLAGLSQRALHAAFRERGHECLGKVGEQGEHDERAWIYPETSRWSAASMADCRSPTVWKRARSMPSVTRECATSAEMPLTMVVVPMRRAAETACVR